MSAKRMDLKKKSLFILSGVTNPLGKHLAIEMCNRFQTGSLVMLIDVDDECLQEVRKEIESLTKGLQVICCNLMDWQNADSKLFHNLLATVLSLPQQDGEKQEEIEKQGGGFKQFEFALMIHNEGTFATHMLMEPQNAESWMAFATQHLYAPVALNQEFIKCAALKDTPKLLININSQFMLQPMFYSSLKCSCKKARDMYFRSIASDESLTNVTVMSYAPGILKTHQPQYDDNNNVINVSDVINGDEDGEKLLKLPRVEPKQATLKLINILEEISFISGHDVDYYDTYVL
ncbi:sepiapterin reductase [Musca autumnalis]|uniref:sepiapterin reductase n=1 Tax=Musca autumnalis TaxID=221902 RepID=UPI003CE8C468